MQDSESQLFDIKCSCTPKEKHLHVLCMEEKKTSSINAVWIRFNWLNSFSTGGKMTKKQIKLGREESEGLQ